MNSLNPIIACRLVSDVYIYNIFLNGEYVNINAHGTADNPVNNAVLTELVTKWNNFVHDI